MEMLLSHTSNRMSSGKNRMIYFLCLRCLIGSETLIHSFWTCPSRRTLIYQLRFPTIQLEYYFSFLTSLPNTFRVMPIFSIGSDFVHFTCANSCGILHQCWRVFLKYSLRISLWYSPIYKYPYRYFSLIPSTFKPRNFIYFWLYTEYFQAM